MTRPPTPPDNADADAHWDALARFITGESDPAEAARIRHWLDEDPSHRSMLETLDRSLRPLAFQPPADLDVEAALQRVRNRLPETDVLPLRTRTRERAPAHWRTTIVRIAAAVALVLGGTLLYRAMRDTGPALATAALTYTTRVGQVDSVTLSDGTRVVLGPGSQLTVPPAYGGSERTVALTGEALFDVIHDGNRPFRVRAGTAVILDLGTTFTVRSHSAGNEVRVVVTSGSVLLRADLAADSGVILNAGDRGVLARGERASVERDVATADDVAWTSGQLIFRDASIDDVARELHRWYGIELRVSDPVLAGRHVTATFQGEDIAQVLAVLELALGTRIERRGDTAFVRAP